MSAGWVLYALAVSTLLAGAAALLEAALRLGRHPARAVWLAALLATLGLVASAPARSAPPAAPEVAGGEASATIPAAGLVDGALGDLGRSLAPLDRAPVRTAAAAGWGALSGILLLAFGTTLLRAARLRRRWPRRELQGVGVRVAPGTGPLVAGVVRPEIVVPEWLLSAPAPQQKLVLMHEAEHLRGRDPLLLAAGGLLAALLPWMPAAWWMLARLRLAVELDCDARVLRGGAGRGEYGSVLLDVAARQRGSLLWAPALLEGPSQLERRLLLMTTRIPRFAAARGAALGALSGALLLAACEAALPTAPEIEEMDVAAAESGAQQMGFLVLSEGEAAYTVDGAPASPDEAQALDPQRIASIEVTRTFGQDGERKAVHIRTREGVAASGDPAPAGERVRITLRGLKDGDPPKEIVASRVRSGSHVRVGTLPETQGFSGVLLIDGRRADPSELRALTPERIEKIEVVKGSAAERLHDAPEAKNGIIRITTKGKEGS